LFAELRAARDVLGLCGRVHFLIGTAFPRKVPDMTHGSARRVLVTRWTRCRCQRRCTGGTRRCDRLGHRIAAVRFTLTNLAEDPVDVGSNFDGVPDLEFRLVGTALDLEQSGLSYQRIPPDYRFPYGHTHKEQEEVFVVVGGSGRMKLDDEIVEVKKWDAVRVPPGTWRGYEAGPEGLEILLFGAPHLGESPCEDVEGQRDWWAD
jgi:mannose-6-phosphate isomerase-like protein (cupin superfamily)